jgi:hypothetical protein
MLLSRSLIEYKILYRVGLIKYIILYRALRCEGVGEEVGEVRLMPSFDINISLVKNIQNEERETSPIIFFLEMFCSEVFVKKTL